MDQKTILKPDTILPFLVYATLAVLSLSLVTSMSLLSLSHILMIVPILYFLPKANYKNYPISAWALLMMTLVIIISIIVNQDIATNGYKPLGKTKYFFYGFLMIAPFSYYLKNFFNEKKISYLVYAFCLSTTLAMFAGMIGMNTGYNYVSMKAVNLDRNAGLFGMVLNYAHNLAYFQIIIFGLIVFQKRVKHVINIKFLYVIFVLNLVGLYFSYTRGAMLALAVGLPFYFFKNNKIKFLIVGLFLAIFATSTYFFSGTSLLRPGSDKERISQWIAATKAFSERPILGFGYLNFENHSVPLKKKYGLGQLQFGGHAHNNFLEMLATTGFIGFICFVGWLVAWFSEMYRRDDLVAKISLPYIIVFVVSGLTQSTISLGVNLFFIMAVYSLGQASAKNNS